MLLWCHHGTRTDQARQRSDDTYSREVRRALHALGNVHDPAAQRLGQQFGVERCHGWQGIALPPVFASLPADGLWSPCLSPAQQLDKAMALAMQHDLQGRLPLKKRLRRLIQCVLSGRRWPITGANEFFRKAVRRHELFWVRHL